MLTKKTTNPDNRKATVVLVRAGEWKEYLCPRCGVYVGSFVPDWLLEAKDGTACCRECVRKEQNPSM